MVAPVKKLQTLETGPCYHCEIKARTNLFCDNWRIWTCGPCLTKHHRSHHKTCAVEIPRESAQEVKTPQYFVLSVTRFDGRKMSMSCRLGIKLEMEDHWMGTYIFVGTGMVLVQENRATINERILLGLKAV